MSLVDYASSDEDEADVAEEQRNPVANPIGKASISNDNPPPQQHAPANQKPLKSSSKQHPDTSLHNPETSLPKLPDASLLLNSPSMPSNVGGYDHSSRVAAAMAQNESRKRDSKLSTSTFPRAKVPRGNLPHPKGIPDTVGGLLRPPQLSGRSNVVTEDISKLFVRKAEPSSN